MYTIHGLSLDPLRVNHVLRAELDAFLRDWPRQNITAQAELQTFLVLWVARFAPEVVSSEVRGLIREIVAEAHESPRYRTDLWFQIMPLEASLLALGGDAYAVRPLIANVDHHNSSLRGLVLDSLALVADLCSFRDDEYQMRVVENLRVRQFNCEWAAVLLLLARGPDSEKRGAVDRWLKECRPQSHEAGFLTRVAAGELMPNPHFSNLLLRVTSYTALRMACGTPDVSGTERAGKQRQVIFPWYRTDVSSAEYTEEVLDANAGGRAPREQRMQTPARPLARTLFEGMEATADAEHLRDYTSKVWERLQRHPLAIGWIRVLPTPPTQP